MSKKTKKSLNKKEFKERKEKKLSKQQLTVIITIVAFVFVITAASITTAIIKKRINDRTVHIAFYGLPQEICKMIEEKIPEEEKVILQFDVLSEKGFDAALVKEKYDMLFTWRGELTDYLSESSEDIPQRILENIPNSLRNKKCIPILLDHCEFAFRTELVKKISSTVPLSYRDFNEYLNDSKKYAFSPFFCNGAEDRTLVDFVGAMVQARGGLAAYNKLITEMRKAEGLDDVIDTDLGDTSLRQILDMLKEWPKNGLAHPAWFNGRGNDLLYFVEDGQVSVFFNLLSQHRTIPYNIIRNYEASFIPTDVSPKNYGIIAPAISAMLISDNSNCKRYLAKFFTEEVQEEFSNKTMLAPVHYRAQAYDRQADDVRFWTASCAGGAIPDLYLAVYQRNTAALEKMAADIRLYVR